MKAKAPRSYVDHLAVRHQDGERSPDSWGWCRTFRDNVRNQYRPPGETSTSMPGRMRTLSTSCCSASLDIQACCFCWRCFFSNWGANHRRILEIGRLPGAMAETQRRLLVCNDSSLIAFAVAGAFLSGIYYPHVFVLAGLSAAIALQYRRAMTDITERSSQHDELAMRAAVQDITAAAGSYRQHR